MKIPTGRTGHPPAQTTWCPAELLLMVCLVGSLSAGVLRSQPLQSANDRSRWCTVWSLVERHTYQIDDIDQNRRFSTIDKVRHRSNDQEPWHFYSSKPPLLSTMVAGLYWIERKTIGLGLIGHTEFVTRLLLVFVNLIPMIAGLFSLRNCLRLLNVRLATRLFLLASAGAGSMLNPYLNTLNNHTPAAVCILFCVTTWIRIEKASRSESGKLCPLDFAILGCCAAFSCCFELPAALFSLACFGFALRKSVSRTATAFVPAALIPLAAFFITNWICTGGLKPFYAYYGTEKYVYTHNGVPSYWSQPRGMDANNEAWPQYLFHCILGHHGIVSLSPIMLLSIAGWLRIHRWKRSEQPADATVCDVEGCDVATGIDGLEADSGNRPQSFDPSLLNGLLQTGWMMTVATLLFYLTRTANYNYGGNSAALRWMLWLSPLWWIAMIPFLEAMCRCRKRFGTASFLLALSVFTAAWSQDRPWKPSWLFEALKSAGWIHYALKDSAQPVPDHLDIMQSSDLELRMVRNSRGDDDIHKPRSASMSGFPKSRHRIQGSLNIISVDFSAQADSRIQRM